jgi:hypothetical protein
MQLAVREFLVFEILAPCRCSGVGVNAPRTPLVILFVSDSSFRVVCVTKRHLVEATNAVVES